MKTDKFMKALPWVIFALGAAAYISLIFNNNVWMDEAFTANLVNTGMQGVIRRSMLDTLPPLYNIYLKIMTDIFGYTVPIMKLASVIPMVLSMLLAVTVVKKRHGNLVSSIFCLALFAMPLMLHFCIEIRMYSLGFFFATASGIFAYEVIYDSCIKNWIWFTVLSVLAGYSHHFAFVTAGAVYLYILLYYIIRDRAHIKRFFICLLATFVLYLPCLIITLKQISRVSGYFSMPEMTLAVVLKYMYYPYTVNERILSVILVLVILILAVSCIITIFRDKENASSHMYALFLFLIYYGVLAFGTVVTKVMSANIFVDRYLFFSTGLLWLFFSIEAVALVNRLSESKSPSGKIIIASVLFLFILVIGIFTYKNEFKSEYDTSPDEMCEYLNSNVNEGDALVIAAETEALIHCLKFYEPRLTYCYDIGEAKDLIDNGEGHNIWIAVDKADSTLDNLAGISDSDTQPEYINDFSFDRYTFEIYRISK